MITQGRPKGELGIKHRQAALGLGVLVAHASLYVGLAMLLRQPSARGPESAAPAIAWLTLPPALHRPQTPEPAAPARQPPSSERQARPAPPVRAFDAVRSAPVAVEPAADLARADAAWPAASHAAAPVPGPAASQAAPPPLNLALPRRQPGERPSAAALASQDERLQNRPGRDERLAQTLGTDSRLQETQRGTVHRFRQSRNCVDVEPAREAGLNPFNQSVSATPRQARPC